MELRRDNESLTHFLAFLHSGTLAADGMSYLSAKFNTCTPITSDNVYWFKTRLTAIVGASDTNDNPGANWPLNRVGLFIFAFSLRITLVCQSFQYANCRYIVMYYYRSKSYIDYSHTFLTL